MPSTSRAFGRSVRQDIQPLGQFPSAFSTFLTNVPRARPREAGLSISKYVAEKLPAFSGKPACKPRTCRFAVTAGPTPLAKLVMFFDPSFSSLAARLGSPQTASAFNSPILTSPSSSRRSRAIPWASKRWQSAALRPTGTVSSVRIAALPGSMAQKFSPSPLTAA